MLIHSLTYPSTYIPLLILVLRYTSIHPLIYSTIYLSISIHLLNYLPLYIYLLNYLPISIHTSTHSPIHLSIHSCMRTHIHSFICKPIYSSVNQSIHSFIIHPSVHYLGIPLCFHPFIYLNHLLFTRQMVKAYDSLGLI